MEKDGRYEYSLVMGLDKVSVSFCSSNEYCENIMHGLVVKLREHCAVDGYQVEEKEFASSLLEVSTTNVFES